MFQTTGEEEPSYLYDKIIESGRPAHNLSDSIVNTRLIALFADRKLYARAIGCFYYIFHHLENLLESSKDHRKVFGASNQKKSYRDREIRSTSSAGIQAYLHIARPLYRSDAFKRDLEFFLGQSWRQDIAQNSQLASVNSYITHLDHVATQDPLMLIAHSFTQHLAMASGGQILKRIIKRGLALQTHDGTRIFDFEANNSRTLKMQVKTHMNKMRATKDEECKVRTLFLMSMIAFVLNFDPSTMQLIQEHQKVFTFNNTIIKSFPTGILAPILAVIKLPLRSKMVVWTVSAVAVAGLAWCAFVRVW